MSKAVRVFSLTKLGKRAAKAYEEWRRDRSVARPYREVRKELMAEACKECGCEAYELYRRALGDES